MRHHRLEEANSPSNVDVEVSFRLIEGLTNISQGREVEDTVRSMAHEDAVDEIQVSDITFLQGRPGIKGRSVPSREIVQYHQAVAVIQ